MTQDSMMICKSPLNCKEICPLYCPYRKPPEWSRACAEGHGESCPACIPVEPEPQELECDAGDMFKARCPTRLSGRSCAGCLNLRRKVEPQPATCPDLTMCNRCGWIPIEGMAKYLQIQGEDAECIQCHTKLTPADLQPKHCTIPSERSCHEPISSCKDCECAEQPTSQQMPLIELPIECLGCDIVSEQRDADMAWHKEQVAEVKKAKWRRIFSHIHITRKQLLALPLDVRQDILAQQVDNYVQNISDEEKLEDLRKLD